MAPVTLAMGVRVVRCSGGLYRYLCGLRRIDRRRGGWLGRGWLRVERIVLECYLSSGDGDAVLSVKPMMIFSAVQRRNLRDWCWHDSISQEAETIRHDDRLVLLDRLVVPILAALVSAVLLTLHGTHS